MESKKAKENILKAFHEKSNSHAFLLETNSLNECLEDVLDIVSQVNCLEDGREECTCKICNYIRNNSLPDLRLIKDEGKEIKVEGIQELLNAFSTSPFISNYQTYIIYECDKLNRSSVNKLLKFLEEPSESILGFYITESIDNVLPTIVSRCERYSFEYGANNILSLLNLNEDSYGKYYDKTMELLFKLENNPKYELMANSQDYGKKDREEILNVINLIKRIYTIKFENLVFNYYNNLEFAKVILDSVTVNDIGILSDRILLLDEILYDLNSNSIKNITVNKLFLKWV